MKKTFNINLNGQAFCIDDDACAKLQVYIETLEKHYLTEADGKEIMGCLIDINGAYRLVTVGVVVVTLFAVAVLWCGKFANPVQKNFLYFRFCTLWKSALLRGRL